MLEVLRPVVLVGSGVRVVKLTGGAEGGGLEKRKAGREPACRCPCWPLQGCSPHPAPGRWLWSCCPDGWRLCTARCPWPAALGSRGHSRCSEHSADLDLAHSPESKEVAQEVAQISGHARRSQGRDYSEKRASQREEEQQWLTIPLTFQETLGCGWPDASQVRLTVSFSFTHTFLSFDAIHGGPFVAKWEREGKDELADALILLPLPTNKDS